MITQEFFKESILLQVNSFFMQEFFPYFQAAIPAVFF